MKRAAGGREPTCSKKIREDIKLKSNNSVPKYSQQADQRLSGLVTFLHLSTEFGGSGGLDRFFASLRKSKCVGESDYIMVVVTGGQIFYLAHIDPLYLTILAGDVS